MSPGLSHLSEKMVDFFFPRQCVGCGKFGDFVCPSCLRILPKLLPPFCPKCSKPQSEGKLCSSCQGRQSKIDGIRSPFRFEGVIRQAIHELKYNNLKALSRPLAQFLAGYLEGHPLPAEVLVAVPLHRQRLKERGYNQSSLLACELGKITGLLVSDDSLIRYRNSSPQARATTVEERRQNVNEAFVCRSQGLRGKQVVLVDDVCTSGATLEACAVAVKLSGASSVWGLTLAREI